ncbi:-specific DARPin, partial, partial [Paramuricea clavata]
HGANVNARNDWNESALHVAVQAHSLEIVKYLVEHDADVNCKNLLNESALHYAAIIGSLEIVEYLVGHGAEVRSGDHCGENTVLFLACKQGNGLIVDYLLQHGAVHDIHKCDVRLRSPLRIACEKGDTCVAEILLKFNVDLRKEQKLFYDNDEIMDILELELESIKRREHAKISKETDDAQ